MTPLVIALLIALAGACVYALAPDKLAEVGRAFLWAGAFAIALLLCGLP